MFGGEHVTNTEGDRVIQMKEAVTFRYAQRKDTHLILQFIKELADYEKMLHEVVADEVTLEEWIFDKQKAEVLFAVVDGKEIGFALFFHNFFHLPRPCRNLSGRLVCETGIPRQRLWKSDFEKIGIHCR